MATMKDIIQSPLLPALFGSMALGLFASSASGKQGGQGRHQGRAAGSGHHDSALTRRTSCRLRLRAGRPCGHLHHRDAAHRHPYLLCAVEEGQDPGSR